MNLDKDLVLNPVSQLKDWKLIVNSTAFSSLDESLEYVKELKKQIERKNVFVKCKAPECFPEHKYNESENIFYCEKLEIGSVNWD